MMKARRWLLATAIGVLAAAGSGSPALASASPNGSCVGQIVSVGAQQIVPFGAFVHAMVAATDNHFGQDVASVTATEPDRSQCTQP